MKSAIAAMALLFAATFATGVVGLLLLPIPWSPVFGSLAGLAGFGIVVAGYAVKKS